MDRTSAASLDTQTNSTTGTTKPTSEQQEPQAGATAEKPGVHHPEVRAGKAWSHAGLRSARPQRINAPGGRARYTPPASMTAFILGMKVKYLPQPEWGVGHLVSVEEGGARAVVMFPGRENGEPLTVSTRSGVLQPAALER